MPKLDVTQNLANEFMNVFMTIVQEGYERYKVPQSDQGAETFSDERGREFQKDMQVIHEFIRQATYLVRNQGADISQMINRIKAEQGGAFWQRLQQTLEKGLPTSPEVFSQKIGVAETLEKQTQQATEMGKGKADSELIKAEQLNPGRAILELFKAETNPKTQIENMVLALQTLKRDGFEDSSRKLTFYLGRRWGMSDAEMKHFLGRYSIAHFQGPTRKKEVKSFNGWYPLIALSSIPLVMLLGAIILGVVVTAAVFLINYYSSSKS
jgi:hypothetical protein